MPDSLGGYYEDMKKYIIVLALVLSLALAVPTTTRAFSLTGNETIQQLLQIIIQLQNQLLQILLGRQSQPTPPVTTPPLTPPTDNGTIATVFKNVQFTLPSCQPVAFTGEDGVYHPAKPDNTFTLSLMQDGVARFNCVAYWLGNVSSINKVQNKGVVAIYANYGASATDLYLVLTDNSTSPPRQLNYVNIRQHPNLKGENLFRVGVKDIKINDSGLVSVTALVVPWALKDAAGYLQNANQPIEIEYLINNNQLGPVIG